MVKLFLNYYNKGDSKQNEQTEYLECWKWIE